MNKYMQKRMRQWEKAEQHPLNQEALEILRVLYAISEDPENAHLKVPDELEDPPTMSYPDLPILDLLRWGESLYLLYDLESPSMNPMLYQLERMVMDGEEPNRLMKLIAGPHGEGSIAVNLWTLLEGTPKQKEEIKSELRSNLKYLLEGARHVLNLRRQRRELLRAQQKKRENQVSVLTPEQEELLLDTIEVIIEDETVRLIAQDTLNESEQELLAALQTTAKILTSGQEELLLDTIEVIIEDETVRLIAQDTLNESEQELLEALQVAGVSLESTQGTRITQETKTEPEPIEAPNISSAPEKTVHYSEDQIKDIVADYFKSLRMASPNYSVKREYLIQMGSDRRRADIAFLRNGKLVAIVECKRTGRVENGNEQLKSYLCATDTFLGIFANDGDPNKWTFWENHRHNNFLEIDRKTFENYIYNHDKAIQGREKR